MAEPMTDSTNPIPLPAPLESGALDNPCDSIISVESDPSVQTSTFNTPNLNLSTDEAPPSPPSITQTPTQIQTFLNNQTEMSSPTTASPISAPLQGHSALFGSNNPNNGVLRSPSLSSGSVNNGNGTLTSTSSATTTMTTTHSSALTGNGNGTTLGSITGGSSGVSDVKLKRFLEHNQRLKEQLDMRRISVKVASQSLIKFVTSTKDALLPSLWGNAPSDPFSKQSTGCCTIS